MGEYNTCNPTRRGAAHLLVAASGLVEFHAGKVNGKKMMKALGNVAALEKGLGAIMGTHFKAHVVPVGAGETAEFIADQAAAQFKRLRRELAESSAKGVEMHTATQALVAEKGDAIIAKVDASTDKVDALHKSVAELHEKVDDLRKRSD